MRISSNSNDPSEQMKHCSVFAISLTRETVFESILREFGEKAFMPNDFFRSCIAFVVQRRPEPFFNNEKSETTLGVQGISQTNVEL